MTKIRTKILNFLKTVDEATLTTIFIQTNIPFYVAKEELKRLEQEGLIISRTNLNETYTYYKINIPIKETEKINGGLKHADNN